MMQSEQPGHDAAEAPADDVDRTPVLRHQLFESAQELAHGLVVRADVEPETPRCGSVAQGPKGEPEWSRRDVTRREARKHQHSAADAARRRGEPGSRQHEGAEFGDRQQFRD